MIKKILYTLCIFYVATCASLQLIQDISKVGRGYVHHIFTPTSIEELHTIVVNTSGPISVAGARCSQGGHIWYPHGVVIDTKKLNHINVINRAQKTITVEAGITWREIQQAIAPLNLSIKVMQSYNDFSVGGSLSVNVHGRDNRYGQLIETVESLRVMLADGSIVTANRSENADLFSAVMGGYGVCGIIIEATLSLTDNYPVACKVVRMNISDYKDYFFTTIYKNPEIALHNANLYPDDLQEVLSIGWYKTPLSLTVADSIRPLKKYYLKEALFRPLLRDFSWIRQRRVAFDEVYMCDIGQIVGRTYEMSYSIASLEHGDRNDITDILQEYFIPVDNLEAFVDTLRAIISDYGVSMLNVSIRYVPGNTESLLTYAPVDSFALVCYICLENTATGYYQVAKWTQMLIDRALELKGAYYCPYQLFARPDQFKKAYPGYERIQEIRALYDPQTKFSNCFLQQYLK